MWLHNRLNEIDVQAYNESDPIRLSGGLSSKSRSDPITLSVLIVPPKDRFKQTDNGKSITEILRIQISNHELEDKNFEIISGRTHIIKDGNDYKVSTVMDASYMNQVQLKEVELRRKLPMRIVE